MGVATSVLQVRPLLRSCSARAEWLRFRSLRVGKAMLHQLYWQKRSRNSVVGAELKRQLKWWAGVLMKGVAEARPWKPPCSKQPLRMLVDAASTPPRCAAILIGSGSSRQKARNPCLTKQSSTSLRRTTPAWTSQQRSCIPACLSTLLSTVVQFW